MWMGSLGHHPLSLVISSLTSKCKAQDLGSPFLFNILVKEHYIFLVQLSNKKSLVREQTIDLNIRKRQPTLCAS